LDLARRRKKQRHHGRPYAAGTPPPLPANAKPSHPPTHPPPRPCIGGPRIASSASRGAASLPCFHRRGRFRLRAPHPCQLALPGGPNSPKS
jgi:hypothetical protein